MSRPPRIVVPGSPHHVTQRGVRKQRTFFNEGDYRSYVRLLAEACRRFGVRAWAWCLMPNHMHLLAVPETEDSLAKAIGWTQCRHAGAINRRQDCTGHLWQERFYSCLLDSEHAMAAARYVELNPVRAGLVASASEHRWSSAAFHLTGKPDGLTVRGALEEEVDDWRAFLDDDREADDAPLRRHTRAGFPLGGESFLDDIERRLGRAVRPGRRGRKRTASGAGGAGGAGSARRT